MEVACWSGVACLLRATGHLPEGRENLVNLVLLVARLGGRAGAYVLSHFEHTLWETWAEGFPSSPASYTLVCIGKLEFLSKSLNLGCEMFWPRGQKRCLLGLLSTWRGSPRTTGW